MRVTHVVQTLVAGGAETMIRTLCPGLAAAGVDTRVISVYPSGLDATGERALGVPLIELDRHSSADVGYFPKLVRTLRALRPDVVHAHLHVGQYPGRLAAVIAGAPSIVLTVHGDERGGAVRRFADRVLHPRTDRFIVFTEMQRLRYAAAEHVPLQRVLVIPNGVAVPVARRLRADVRAEIGVPEGAFVVFAIGRLAPEKNQAAALDALAVIGAAGADDVHLVLAGTGPLADELRARAVALAVADRVHFLGHRADAPEIASAMDVFLLTSLRERMPLALGEAMLAGLAPIITPWPGSDDLIRDGENGFVARGFDGGAIADAVLRAYHDRANLTRAARAAAASARTAFDIDAMVRGHVDLYTSLTKARPA